MEEGPMALSRIVLLGIFCTFTVPVVEGKCGRWSDWSDCSRTCGGGLQTRTRATEGWLFGDCKETKQSRPCNTGCCPVDCQWFAWGAWSSCSAKCGAGHNTRTRSMIPASCGGVPCSGFSTSRRPCNMGPCPDDCLWGEWSDWTDCDKECGGGQQERNRAVLKGGAKCQSSKAEVRRCNTFRCPRKCRWGAWTKWSTCSVSCGTGEQERKRERVADLDNEGSGDVDQGTEGSGEVEQGNGGSGEAENQGEGSGEAEHQGEGSGDAELTGEGSGDVGLVDEGSGDEGVAAEGSGDVDDKGDEGSGDVDDKGDEGSGDEGDKNDKCEGQQVQRRPCMLEECEVPVPPVPAVDKMACPEPIEAEDGARVIQSQDMYNTKFCHVIFDQSATGDFYSLEVKLFHVIRARRRGFLGAVYNVIDPQNYDFIYFRTYNRYWCYQYGYIENGKLVMPAAWSGSCRFGAALPGMWFKVEVKVIGNEARILKDSIEVTTVTPHFPATGRGGVLVSNGYSSVIKSEDYQLYEIRHPADLDSIKQVGCPAISHPTFLVADLETKRPHRGFCQSLVEEAVDETSYSVSVELYSETVYGQRQTGLMGLMFNAEDSDNFEYFFVSADRVNHPFFHGRVVNGKSERPLLVPHSHLEIRRDKWVKVNLQVTQNEAHVSLDGTPLDFATLSRFCGKAGVLLPNGAARITKFKHYTIS